MKTFFVNLNASIDVKADNFVAGYHNRPIILLAMLLVGIMTFLGAIMNTLCFFGIIPPLRNDEWAVWHYSFTTLSFLCLPLVAMWWVHICRNASWHLYHCMDKTLGDFVD